MVVKQEEQYKIGYNPICVMGKVHADMYMDVGVIKLEEGDSYTNDNKLERAILLIEGAVTFKWANQEVCVQRSSCFDENPICLHLPQSVKVTIEGNGTSELMYQAIGNTNNFEPKLYGQEDTVSKVFGNESDETYIRTVRTVIDDDIAPYSNLVIGEVINHPGRWSSYPPHYHMQPEVYHYRFLPEQGFGVSILGDEAYKVEHRSTSMVPGNAVHPQASAPGYGMYYVWMIPHAPERWLREKSTFFDDTHTWVLEKDAKIWSDKSK